MRGRLKRVYDTDIACKEVGKGRKHDAVALKLAVNAVMMSRSLPALPQGTYFWRRPCSDQDVLYSGISITEEAETKGSESFFENHSNVREGA